MDSTLADINTENKDISSSYNPSDSLAKTMGNPLKTKDNDLASTVGGGSPKTTKNKTNNPHQISLGLDKYEEKLTKKRS